MHQKLSTLTPAEAEKICYIFLEFVNLIKQELVILEEQINCLITGSTGCKKEKILKISEILIDRLDFIYNHTSELNSEAGILLRELTIDENKLTRSKQSWRIEDWKSYITLFELELMS